MFFLRALLISTLLLTVSLSSLSPRRKPRAPLRPWMASGLDPVQSARIGPHGNRRRVKVRKSWVSPQPAGQRSFRCAYTPESRPTTQIQSQAKDRARPEPDMKAVDASVLLQEIMAMNAKGGLTQALCQGGWEAARFWEGEGGIFQENRALFINVAQIFWQIMFS